MITILLSHSGCKRLLVYKKSYQGTVVFCRRFLPPRGDRSIDQMVQAARSRKQNIAEDSAAAGTSSEAQIELTSVARASLDELMEDYLDCLKADGSAEWSVEREKKTAAREFSKYHSEWEDWKLLSETNCARRCLPGYPLGSSRITWTT